MSNQTYPFPHTRLDVYHVALQMAAQSKKVADRIPRGHRSLADQLLRASNSVVLNIAEGANRFTAGAKRQRFSEAHGEAGEVAAAADLLTTLSLIPSVEAETLVSLSSRIGAMLTSLLLSLD